MSQYYKIRTKGLFNPKSEEPFRVSRSKIDLFMQCPRCFYLDIRLGIGRPPGFPFSLNSAVDTLLKKEFDHYRANGEPHPLMVENNIDAVPFKSDLMPVWRDAFKGMRFLHPETNFMVTGAIDDLWVSPQGIHIVDYKATSKIGNVSLDADWQIGYKRQMEIYQWLFRKGGYNISDTGYFVYCNGLTTPDMFNARLEFTIKVLPYIGKTDWIEETLPILKACLMEDDYLKAEIGIGCDYCQYIMSLREVLKRVKQDREEKTAGQP